MSRAGQSPDVIPVQAGSNVYTALAAVAVIVQILALTAMFLKYNNAFGGYPFVLGF